MSELAKRKLWFERNERAEELEAEGKSEEALKLYEENVAEGCDVAYTYERMAALLRAQGRHHEEVEALERALAIEEKRGPTGQMIRLQKRIETAKDLRERKGQRPPVSVRTTSTSSSRRQPVKKKQKKGCLGVFALLLGSVSLLAALFV